MRLQEAEGIDYCCRCFTVINESAVSGHADTTGGGGGDGNRNRKPLPPTADTLQCHSSRKSVVEAKKGSCLRSFCKAVKAVATTLANERIPHSSAQVCRLLSFTAAAASTQPTLFFLEFGQFNVKSCHPPPLLPLALSVAHGRCTTDLCKRSKRKRVVCLRREEGMGGGRGKKAASVRLFN